MNLSDSYMYRFSNLLPITKYTTNSITLSQNGIRKVSDIYEINAPNRLFVIGIFRYRHKKLTGKTNSRAERRDEIFSVIVYLNSK